MKHLSSPTPFLHPAGNPILTLKIMKFMESKMLDLLLGQEVIIWFLKMFLFRFDSFNITLIFFAFSTTWNSFKSGPKFPHCQVLGT